MRNLRATARRLPRRRTSRISLVGPTLQTIEHLSSLQVAATLSD